MIYCIVPEELAEQLHEPLRRHFLERADVEVEVIVERRGRERRRAGERRAARGSAEPPGGAERRRVRHPADAGGRRVGERRVAVAEASFPTSSLPRRARRHAERLRFVERVRPSGEELEDLDTARVVTRIQAGEQELFEVLYQRYFDRVYSYLKLALDDHHEAEDMAQEVFIDVLEALPRYELRSAPFRGWLFRIVRNRSINLLRRRGRIELEEPEAIERRIEAEGAAAGAGGPDGLDDLPEELRELPEALEDLDWIADRDLMVLVERLPAAQQQVIALRYLMGFGMNEIAEAMGREPAAIRQMHRRAILFLGERLTAARKRTSGRPQPARAITKQAWVVRNRKFCL